MVPHPTPAYLRSSAMPYRAKAEAPLSPPPTKDGLQCVRCHVPVSPDDGRCPQCLRRSTVAGPGMKITSPDATDVPPARVWPATTTCPLCAEREVDASHVFLRLSKIASDVGSRSASMVIRLRTCSPCRAQVESLDRWRVGGAASVIVGLVATFGFFTQTVIGGGCGVLGVALFVSALTIVSTKNRRLRENLDDAGITDALADRIPDLPGLFHIDSRHLSAETKDPTRAVDLGELMPSRRERRLPPAP